MNLKDEVDNIIQTDVLPVLQSHGGSIKVRSVQDKIVTITLLGNCSTCPLSQITTEELVQAKLKEKLGDRIEKVRLHAEVSDEMWDYAKKILRKPAMNKTTAD